MTDERRVAEQERWAGLDKHMAVQTVHMEHTVGRLEKIENSLNGIDVKALSKTVIAHSTTLNKIKGGAAVTAVLVAIIKGWDKLVEWIN